MVRFMFFSLRAAGGESALRLEKIDRYCLCIRRAAGAFHCTSTSRTSPLPKAFKNKQIQVKSIPLPDTRATERDFKRLAHSLPVFVRA
jgi:hypothetical protein